MGYLFCLFFICFLPPFQVRLARQKKCIQSDLCYGILRCQSDHQDTAVSGAAFLVWSVVDDIFSDIYAIFADLHIKMPDFVSWFW